jgi:hypothetical protein
MPAIDFPNSPTVNQEFTANGRTWIWSGTVWESKAVDTTVSRYKVGDAAPSSPVNGDVWFNSTNARTYVYYDSFWVESNPALDGKSGVSAVASPLTNTGTPTSAVLGLNYNALQYGQNAIINGAFDIWQRGTGISSTSSGEIFAADRWVLSSNGTGLTRTASQLLGGVSISSGIEAASVFRYNQSVAGTGATYNVISQKIEDVSTLAGKTVTLSFYAKSSVSYTLSEVGFHQYFGTGGSSELYTFSQTASNPTIGTSWARHSVTINLPSISNKTIGPGSFLRVFFSVPLNTVSIVDFWGVQLEAGSTATPFKRNAGSIQGELAACQRYYYRASCTAANPYGIFTQPMSANLGNQAYLPVRLPVTMRTPPTSVESANLQLADNVNAGVTVTGVFLDVNTTSDNIAAAGFNVSSGLTQYRSE